MYQFSFTSVGGATRVKIHSGEDIRHLGELDKKMWTVLSCPTTGLEIDSESLSFMDCDMDGQLHVEDVIRTSEWLCTVLKDPQSLMEGTDQVQLSNIADRDLATVAAKIGIDSVSPADVDNAIAQIKIEIHQNPDLTTMSDERMKALIRHAVEAKIEWAKRESCWEKAKEISIPFSEQFKAELNYKSLEKDANDQARRGQKEQDNASAMIRVHDYGAENWKKVLDWGKANRIYTAKEISLLNAAVSMNSKFPSEKQCVQILKILEKAREESYPG